MSGLAWHVGIDVGGTSVRVLGECADGTRGEVVTAAVPDSYDAFLAAVADLVPRAVGGPVTGAACGLPGTADGERPVFVPALPWIEKRPLRDDLARAIGSPVQLALDGHLTLLGEAVEGAAHGHDSAVLVAVGTGVGGAVMVGGRIWRGAHGSAGSFGWLPASGAADSRKHGAFEQVASGSALSALARRHDPALTAEGLVDRARAGDPSATTVVEAYAFRLGRGIAALSSIVDPDVVLVGGGVSAAMDVLGPVVARTIASLASPDGRTVPVRPTALGPHAGVVGALRAAQRGESVWL